MMNKKQRLPHKNELQRLETEMAGYLKELGYAL